MFSARFNRHIQITEHARARMIDRAVNAERLLDLIETGEIKYKDEFRIWIFKAYEDRNDNLICTAAALESALVVKTVMHHFEIT